METCEELEGDRRKSVDQSILGSSTKIFGA